MPKNGKNILGLGTVASYAQADIKNAQKWFSDEIKRNLYAKPALKNMRQRTGDQSITPGKLVYYKYDPKWKEQLPFYDMFPMVMIIDMYKDGFLGLNMHYITPTERIWLFNELLKHLNNKKMNRTTQIKASYAVLKSMSKSKLFAKTIHRYLYSHIQTKVNIVRPAQWPRAIMLPTAKWKKGKPY